MSSHLLLLFIYFLSSSLSLVTSQSITTNAVVAGSVTYYRLIPTETDGTWITTTTTGDSWVPDDPNAVTTPTDPATLAPVTTAPTTAPAPVTDAPTTPSTTSGPTDPATNAPTTIAPTTPMTAAPPVTSAPPSTPSRPIGTTLFFSLYIHGTNVNDTVIQVYNPTSASIDLSLYQLRFYPFGSDQMATMSFKSQFARGQTLLIQPGKTFTIACYWSIPLAGYSDYGTYMRAGTIPLIDGRTAIQLVTTAADATSSEVVLDQIGDVSYQLDVNGWGAGGVTDATYQHTLVRKPTVYNGNTNWVTGSMEWNVLPANTFDPIRSPHVTTSQNIARFHTQSMRRLLQTGTSRPITVMQNEFSSISLNSQAFTWPQAGTYRLSMRVRASADATIPTSNGDLVVSIGGATLANSSDYTFSVEEQKRIASTPGVWQVVALGSSKGDGTDNQAYTVSTAATGGSIYLHNLATNVMMTSKWSGWSFDWVKVEFIAPLPIEEPKLTIVIQTPTQAQLFKFTDLDVIFQINTPPTDFSTPGLYQTYFILTQNAIVNTSTPIPCATDPQSQTPISLIGLQSGTYVIQVVLFKTGASVSLAASAPRQFQVTLPPKPVESITAIDLAYDRITIQWYYNPQAQCTFTIQYRVQNDDNTMGSWQTVPSSAITGTSTGTSQATISGLTVATTYHFAIQAQNQNGLSSWGAASFATAGVIRKPAAYLSQSEISRFLNATRALNRLQIYQKFTRIHSIAMSTSFKTGTGSTANIAHRGPVFGPWHRQFLLDIERQLQLVSGDSTISLPYWDWKINSPIFNNEFMGTDGNRRVAKQSGGYPVTSAHPFSLANGWQTIKAQPASSTDTSSDSLGLTRAFGDNLSNNPTADMASHASQVASLDNKMIGMKWDEPTGEGATSATSFRMKLEELHNTVHVYVGGCMLAGESPNDPIFYLNHAMVDRLYSRWQIANNYRQPYDINAQGMSYDTSIQYGNSTRTSQYPYKVTTTSAFGPKKVGGQVTQGHGGQDAMWPWTGEKVPPFDSIITNRLIIPNQMHVDVAKLGYRYAEVWNPSWDDAREPLTTTQVISIANPTLSIDTQSPRVMITGWTIGGSRDGAIVVDQTSQATVISAGASVTAPLLNTVLTPFSQIIVTIDVQATGPFSLILQLPNGGILAQADYNSVYSSSITTRRQVTVDISVLSSHYNLNDAVYISIVAATTSRVAIYQVSATKVPLERQSAATQQTSFSWTAQRLTGGTVPQDEAGGGGPGVAIVTSSSSSSSGIPVAAIIGVAVGAFIFLLMGLAAGYVMANRKHSKYAANMAALNMQTQSTREPAFTMSPIHTNHSNATVMPPPPAIYQ